MDVASREDEELLLDLLNTTPVVEGVQTDELVDATSAKRWSKARGGTGTAAEATTLRAVRDAIQRVVEGTSAPDTLAAHLEKVNVTPRLRDGALVWEPQAGEDHALATRVLLAWAVINDQAPDRLRPCANPDCCRFLHDRSNANTARWCSMSLCGNRAKARRHYQRKRASAQ